MFVIAAAFQNKKSCSWNAYKTSDIDFSLCAAATAVVVVDIIPTKIIVIKKFQRSCTFIMYYRHFVGINHYGNH